MKRILGPFRGWSAMPYPPAGYCGFEAVNYHTTFGLLWNTRRFKIARQVTTGTPTKAGGSWTHAHSDGTERPWYYFNTALYRETGSAASSIATSLSEVFAPSVVQFPRLGWDIFLNGTNAQARLLRVESGDLVAVLLDMAAPTGSASLTGGAGGTLTPGNTIQVRITQIDDTGTPVTESQSIYIGEVLLAGGETRVVVNLAAAGITFAARATKYRVYAHTGTEPVLASFFQTGADTAKATTTFNIDSIGTTTQLPQRNGFERTAVMPLSSVDFACQYLDRLVIGSYSSGLFYWSDRGHPNHWYSTNGINAGQGNWAELLTGLAAAEDGIYAFASTAIYRVSGTLVYDSTSNTHDVSRPETVDRGIGCVGHPSLATIPGFGLFGMSHSGPFAVIAGRPARLAWEHFVPYRDILDFTYARRWVGTYDPDLHRYVCAVGRKVNSDRAMDGQASAGINDRIIAVKLNEAELDVPQEVECVHLSTRKIGTVGATSHRLYLAGFGPHASALQLSFGYADGDADGVVTSTDFDSKLASSSTTQIVTIALAGITLDQLQGMGLTLTYPLLDGTYPKVIVYRTISTNTATSGGNVTISWVGALTVPTTGNWDVRVCGKRDLLDVRVATLDAERPGVLTDPSFIRNRMADTIGAEARA